jgi:KaiC/GvpD/RAD55 family RecA-like ATPase
VKEKQLLEKDNKELNPVDLFKKLKLQKKLNVSPLNVSLDQGTMSSQEIIPDTVNIGEDKKSNESPIQSPVDLLGMSDDEFNKLIDVNTNDEHSASVTSDNIIEKTERRYLYTGVPGFDDLMEKGILEGSSILISGGPGSGKTTFCMQQLGWAAEHGEKCLFLSLEEREDRLVEHMETYGLNPKKYLKEGTLNIKKLDSFKLSRSVEALLAHARGELMIDIDPIMDIIPKGFKPDRIVLDSLSSIAAAFAGEPEVYRIYVEQLFLLFERLEVTSFIITEIQGSEAKGHGGVEDFIADGVINFYNMKKGTRRQPAIEILKMRGVNHKKKVVPFNFVSGKGIEIYPLEEVFYDE